METAPQYASGTKVVEISNGRQFVSRPLRPEIHSFGGGHPMGAMPHHGNRSAATGIGVFENLARIPQQVHLSASAPMSNRHPRYHRGQADRPWTPAGRPNTSVGQSINVSDILGKSPRSSPTTNPMPHPLQALFAAGAVLNANQSTPFMKLLESATQKSSTSNTAKSSANQQPPQQAFQAEKRNPQNGIQWLFDAASASGVSSQWTAPAAANENIQSNSAPMEYIGDPWDFNRPEDIVNDELLFRREEMQRRRHPRYLTKTKRLHDLHIVMPIAVPHGKIVVEDPLGANFYEFSAKHPGARILFGKGVADAHKDENESPSTESPSTEKSDTISPVCDVWASFLHVRLGTIYNLTASQMPIVAELFKSSFDQDLCKFYVPIAMDCRGVHPSSDDLISQRATRRSMLIKENKEGRKVAAERYETHAIPTTDNDIKRLRMLRRHLRQFAARLITDLGFGSSPPINHFADSPMNIIMQMSNDFPRPCIELHDNCRSDTILRGSLKIVVREWSPLSDSEVFKKVWAGQLGSSDSAAGASGVAAEVRTKLLEQKSIPSARVLVGEIRLEHNHLRMVDSRWPNELVPGRRVADQCPENDAPGPEESQARFVFCSRLPNPQVVYAYAQAEGASSDPRDAALACRLSSLFKVHLARHPTAGVASLSSCVSTAPPSASRTPEPNDVLTPGSSEGVSAVGEITPTVEAVIEVKTGCVESAEKKERLTAEKEPQKSISSLSELKCIPEPFVPVLPQSQNGGVVPPLLQKMLFQVEAAAKVLSDQSALDSETTFKVPVTSVACKFFSKGGCARGKDCYFLHPADPRLESKVDVRHIIPKHPKFF